MPTASSRSTVLDITLTFSADEIDEILLASSDRKLEILGRDIRDAIRTEVGRVKGMSPLGDLRNAET